MDILFLLIPLSAGLVLLIIGIFGWALNRGQFDDLDREGERILQDENVCIDGNQGSRQGKSEQSRETVSHL